MIFLLFKSHGHDPLSLLIKALTRSEYVHAAILRGYNPQRCAIFITESYWPHVRTRALAWDELSKIDVYVLDGVTPAQEAMANAWLDQQVNLQTPYDIRDLFLFSPFFRWIFGESKTDPDTKRTFCSMLVFNWAVKAGHALLKCRDIEAAPGFLAWSPLARCEGQLDQWLEARA